jgi:hypothetical protein
MCLHRITSYFMLNIYQDLSRVVANGRDKRQATRDGKRQVMPHPPLLFIGMQVMRCRHQPCKSHNKNKKRLVETNGVLSYCC